MTAMSKSFYPNDNYLIISFQELEVAWRVLASPDKMHKIDESLQLIQTLNRTAGPAKALYSLVAATAWLTEDGTSSFVG